MVISCLTSIILIVLGIVNLQFLGALVPISLHQFPELWQLMSWVQSGHLVVNLSTWDFSIHKDSSQDMIQNIIYSP